MKIDFNSMDFEIKEHFNNGEKCFQVKTYFDGTNKIMYGKLIPGASIGIHTHTDSSEIIYVISGSGKNICNGIEERLNAGDAHYCPKNFSHTFINDGKEDLIFFAVVAKQ